MKKVRADEIQPGMWLDLENDTYANFFNAAMLPVGVDDTQAWEDHQATVSNFEFEYQQVESVERETEDVVRIDCLNTSFGCPIDHKLKVVEPVVTFDPGE